MELELGEGGRGARIELDSRRKRQRQSERHDARQRNTRRLDRDREPGQCTANSVIRNALLGGMADRWYAHPAALGTEEILLQVRQGMQLGRLLREHERNGDQQVA